MAVFAWQLRQAGAVWGSPVTPMARAFSAASGRERLAYARACGPSRQRLYW